MSTHFEHYQSGVIYGVKYRFDRVGDGLVWHQHDKAEEHNIVVLKGAVEFKDENGTRLMTAGFVYDFDSSKLHEITAREPNTVILNLLINGRPTEYDRLRPSCLSGSFDRHTLNPTRYAAPV